MELKKSIVKGLKHCGDLKCNITAFGEGMVTLDAILPNKNTLEISVISDGLYWRGMKVKEILDLDNITFISYRIFFLGEEGEGKVLFTNKQGQYS